jgi:hypothetical protein
MKARDFTGTGPTFRPEDYFNGRTKAWGIFQDRFGSLRRRFTVDITGTWDGETLELVEDFDYTDGVKERRVWKIGKRPDGSYEGRADDVVGVARGTSHGEALNWTYDLLLPINGRQVKVRFDDWMIQQDDLVMVNRATVSKFGVTLGEVTLFFMRVADEDSASATPSLAPIVERKSAA